MLRLATFLYLALAVSALADAFDAHRFGRQDLRVIQAALTLEGDYNALLDGAWGKRSQAGLVAWTRRHFGTARVYEDHVVELVDRFQQVQARDGWQRLWLEPAKVHVQLPLALIDKEPPGENFLSFATPSRNLIVRVIFDSFDGTIGMHRWALQRHLGRAAPYVSERSDRVVSRTLQDGGQELYLRSEPIGSGVYRTVLIQSTPVHATRAALVAASLSTRDQPPLRPAPGGRLAALLKPKVFTGAPPATNRAPSQGLPALAEPKLPLLASARSSGTGFFVNATDLVTAAHVVEDCVAPTLGDGTALTVIVADSRTDIAVVQSAARSAAWLPLGEGTAPRLGRTVSAVGYPFADLSGGALTLTTGNISALNDRTAERGWMSISAPVQPGNSGGPLLDDHGSVVGVVVARASDDFYLEETGTLPQNINFAVRADTVAAFLSAHGVFHSTGRRRTSRCPRDSTRGPSRPSG